MLHFFMVIFPERSPWRLGPFLAAQEPLQIALDLFASQPAEALKQTAKAQKRWCQSDPLRLLVCFFRNW